MTPEEKVEHLKSAVEYLLEAVDELHNAVNQVPEELPSCTWAMNQNLEQAQNHLRQARSALEATDGN